MQPRVDLRSGLSESSLEGAGTKKIGVPACPGQGCRERPMAASTRRWRPLNGGDHDAARRGSR
jgi:hypothetical protein